MGKAKILPCPDCGAEPRLCFRDSKYFTGSQFWGARYFRYVCPDCPNAGYPVTERKGIAMRYWNASAKGKTKSMAVLDDAGKAEWKPVTEEKERPFGVCCEGEKGFGEQKARP